MMPSHPKTEFSAVRQGKKAVVKMKVDLQQDKTPGINDADTLAGSQGGMVENVSSNAVRKDGRDVQLNTLQPDVQAEVVAADGLQRSKMEGRCVWQYGDNH